MLASLSRFQSFNESRCFAGFAICRDAVHIGLAVTARQQQAANELMARLYAARGYHTTTRYTGPEYLTLLAVNEQQAFGTLSVSIDSERGLQVDQLYRREIDEFRARGCRVGELSRLAIDTLASSKEVLATLYHLAYLQLGPIHGVSDVFIEVNPRHARFYQHQLGFRQVADERLCPRVGAPAVLLHLELAHARRQIALHGGTRNSRERSLYPYFMAPEEADRLMRAVGASGQEATAQAVAALPARTSPWDYFRPPALGVASALAS